METSELYKKYLEIGAKPLKAFERSLEEEATNGTEKA